VAAVPGLRRARAERRG